MANHTHNDGKVLGMGSQVWMYLSGLAGVVFLGAGNTQSNFLGTITLLLLLATLWAWILAAIRGRQAQKDQEGQIEIQRLLSSPTSSSKLSADPALYKRAQAELQARKDEALKMQELHALRQQVEEEERKAGIFAPTLSPTQLQSGSKSSQADPTVAMMAELAQRKTEAERQKHLMKSLRSVEDAEWEADDI